MKRIVFVIIALMIMTNPVEAFVMTVQPFGWNGWAWGTPLRDVIGWLSSSGYLEVPQMGFKGNVAKPQLTDQDALLYIRQGEPNDYFSKNKPPLTWQYVYYIFKEDKLRAVLLVGLDAEPAVNADIYFGLNPLDYFGKNSEKIKGPIREASLRKYEYIFGQGETTSYIRVTYPVGLFTDHFYIIIGESEVVNDWINELKETVPAL